MLKYNYWRTVPPQRDWITEPEFDFQRAYYGGHDQARYVAHMFYWLCGKGDEYRIIGGQAWPGRGPTPARSGPPTASAVSAVICRTGASKTRTAMLFEVI